MSQPNTRLSDDYQRVLDESGLVYSVVPRRRHIAVVVAGRQIAVVPRAKTPASPRGLANFRACVRRVARLAGSEGSAAPDALGERASAVGRRSAAAAGTGAGGRAP